MLFMNWQLFKKNKESFVNFQNNNPSTYGSMIYIPQYTSDATHKLVSLYDNLYFDHKNGNLIEVNSTGCPPNVPQASCVDTTGSSISEIYIVPRSGESVTIYPSSLVNPDGSVPSYATKESLNKTITPSYNQFSYRTKCETTDKYQVFYISWNLDTYIYLVNITTPINGKSMKAFYLTPDGLINTQTTNTIDLPLYLKNSEAYPSVSDLKDNTSYTDPNYLNGAVPIYQISQNILYDIVNGNLILISGSPAATPTAAAATTSPGASRYSVYNRGGSGEKTTPVANTPIQQIVDKLNIFSVPDQKGGMVLVMAYKKNTVISTIIPRKNDNSYYLEKSVRFSDKSVVSNASNDNGASTSGTSAPVIAASCPFMIPATGPTSGPRGLPSCPLVGQPSNWADNYNVGPHNMEMNNQCGDDLSCKWFWYFKNLSDINQSQNYFSDDYFAKTEVVPPVCPRCPNCPSSGVCTNCGGAGGCGTVNATTPAATTAATGTTAATATTAAGTTAATSTTAAGTTSATTAAGTTSATTAAGTTSATTAAGTTAAIATTAAKATTAAAADGNKNSIGNVANNVVDSAENIGTGAIGLLKDTGSGAIGLLKDTGSGAVGLLKDTGSGAVGLLKETGSGAVGLLKDIGSGIKDLGKGGLNVNRTTSVTGSGLGATAGAAGEFGPLNVGGGQHVGQPVAGISSRQPTGISQISGKTFGDMNTQGQTPIDNYSYYGALQSKGGSEYMPVTADFSSFRK